MDDEKPKMEFRTSTVQDPSLVRERTQLRNRNNELEAENKRLREQHGEDVERIRQLEAQVEKLKQHVAPGTTS